MFDGARHSMKDVARKELDIHARSSSRYIQSFMEKCAAYENATSDADKKTFQVSNDDRKMYLKALKDISVPDDRVISLVVNWVQQNGIKYVCAHFEAE